MGYSQHFSTLKTAQTVQARGDEVQNNASGFVFQVDKWRRLDRWLILGGEGGTFYVEEKPLVISNARSVLDCLAEDGIRTISRIIEVSQRGLAPKNEPAIFALAMACADKDEKTKKAALAAIPLVCRTGTHLFHFVRDVEAFRRWGYGLKRAVGEWYTKKTPEKLAYQLVKYQQRDGWSHRDVLRLAHPKATSAEHQALFRYVVAGTDGLGERKTHGKTYPGVFVLSPLVAAFEEAKTADKARLCALIREHGLTHEMIPTQWKKDPDVWDALLNPKMPMTAMIRNLGVMTASGLLKPMSMQARAVAHHLADPNRLKHERVHPMSILIAFKTYVQGHGEKGKLSWQPVREITDALSAAFYLAFDAVEPTGKNIMLGLDVSRSMDAPIDGLPLTCREAVGALAMVTARTEKNWCAFGFTSGRGGLGGRFGGGAPTLTEIDISPTMRLDDVVRKMEALPMGGTDCSLPMVYATQEEMDVDAFVILTDNETWAGDVHPYQAVQEYRRKLARPHAKVCVVGMTASEFTIADPRDADMLDVVGMSSDVPALMANFIRGGL